MAHASGSGLRTEHGSAFYYFDDPIVAIDGSQWAITIGMDAASLMHLTNIANGAGHG